MTRQALHPVDSTLHNVEPPPEEKLAQLERLLQSRTLQGSENLKSMLQYIVSNGINDQGVQLKEYTIATEVFGRSDDFDSRTDSVVRVQAKRLRSKLQEYYETEGKSDKILIDLPKGHYNAVFSYIQVAGEAGAIRKAEPEVVEAPTSQPPVQAKPSSSRRREKMWRNSFIATALLLLIAVGTSIFFYRDLRGQAQAARSSAEESYAGIVWAPFLKSDTPIMLVLSNPPVYRFTNAIDPEVVLKNSIQMTPEAANGLAETLKGRFVMRQNHFPRLILSPEDYTGMGEAIGLYRITDLLRSEGRSLVLKQSRTVTADDLKSHNVILLGSVWANEWSGKLPIKEDFNHSVSATIENTNPLPGEEHEYKPKFNEQTGELIEDYSLITVKPSVTDENTLMILAGIHSEGTQAAAEFVTRKEYLNVLNQRLQQLLGQSTLPKYYQAVLKVDVDDGIPTIVSIVTIHELGVTRN